MMREACEVSVANVGNPLSGASSSVRTMACGSKNGVSCSELSL